MVFYIFALVVVALIYFNVFGLFHGYKDIPAGPYKEALWKYKKLEIIEKSVVALIMAVLIISMNYTQETAMIALVGMVLVSACEVPFAFYIRKKLVCPRCNGPVWTGRSFVILRPRRTCEYCGYHFYDKVEETVLVEDTDEQ